MNIRKPFGLRHSRTPGRLIHYPPTVSLLLVVVVAVVLVIPMWSQTVTVNWSTVLQTIDGFGASSAGDTGPLSPALMDFFYTPSGINLHYLRIKIYPNLKDCRADEAPATCVAVASGPTLSTNDLVIAKAAYARGAQIVAAEWSPPGEMKSNRSFATGGNMLGRAENYTKLASLQAAFVKLMKETYGIPIYALSPQNEPDQSTSYPSCTWTAQQIHDYVPYLASALAGAGYSGTKIMVAEQSGWSNSLSSDAMADPKVSRQHRHPGVPRLL